MLLEESNRMYKATLSATLNSEIRGRYPYNGYLLSYKKWSDSLRPLFCSLAHRTLRMFMEWYYERPIYLLDLPIDEQVENVKMKYGYECCPIELPKTSQYVWKGGDDWHH